MQMQVHRERMMLRLQTPLRPSLPRAAAAAQLVAAVSAAQAAAAQRDSRPRERVARLVPRWMLAPRSSILS
jgi:hypothetical protein